MVVSIYSNLSEEQRLKRFGVLIRTLATQMLEAKESEIKKKFPASEKASENMREHLKQFKPLPPNPR